MTALDDAARSNCEDLAVRSYRLIDDGLASEVTPLFVEDGRFEVRGMVEISGQAQLAEFFAARQADTSRRTRHCLIDRLFERTGAATAEIRATLLLFVLGEDGAGPVPIQALADVHDRYRLEDDGWRIAERVTTALAGGR